MSSRILILNDPELTFTFNREVLFLFNPSNYHDYPYMYILPIGIAVAVALLCYYMGAKRRRHAYTLALTVILMTIVAYMGIRLLIPFPDTIPFS